MPPGAYNTTYYSLDPTSGTPLNPWKSATTFQGTVGGGGGQQQETPQQRLRRLLALQNGVVPTAAAADQPKSDYLSYLDAADKAQAAAKNANDTRFAKIDHGYMDRFNRGLGYINQAGLQERADIDRSTQMDIARAGQTAINAGLGATSAKANLQTGAAEAGRRSVGRLNDRLTQQRLSADAGLSADQLQFEERKTDAYPDLSGVADLAMKKGQADAYSIDGAGGAGGGAFGGDGASAYGGSYPGVGGIAPQYSLGVPNLGGPAGPMPRFGAQSGLQRQQQAATQQTQTKRDQDMLSTLRQSGIVNQANQVVDRDYFRRRDHTLGWTTLPPDVRQWLISRGVLPPPGVTA